ncbi:MAG: hypothetical protein B1H08_01490 [Candidatus Omnitrophica bacterium 4484_171]|nr:MAG: hypothetical protein B1H08_01490 [Candidatus Omnitrophica bacterium 4484_171]
MVNLNKVLMVGNLTKDPELRYTPQGSAVATLRLAVNRSFKNKEGEWQKEVCFINVIAWGPLAERCNQYLEKGRGVFVEGSLISRSWKNSEGKTRSVIEVRATSIQFMSRPAKQEPQEPKDIDLGAEPEEIVKLDDGLGEVV